jgi:hypothetical protein
VVMTLPTSQRLPQLDRDLASSTPAACMAVQPQVAMLCTTPCGVDTERQVHLNMVQLISDPISKQQLASIDRQHGPQPWACTLSQATYPGV